MSLLKPASLPWFLRHELRLSWRFMASAGGGKGRSIIIAFVVVIGTALFMAWGFGRLLHARGITAPDLTPLPGAMVVIVDSILAFFTSLMIAQSLASATMIFYDRGDLDLLLASPVKPWKILATRILIMAFNAMIFFQLLTLPVTLTCAAVMGYWGLVALPAVIALFALAATSIGVVLAMTLFKLIGPRRTRSVAQLIGVVTALGIVVTTRLMPINRGGGAGWTRLSESLNASGWGQAATWLARAATGDLLPLVIVALACVGIFAATTVLLGRRFATNASLAAGEAQPVQKPGRVTTSASFKSGNIRTIMLVKELKLVWRDPSLISQVLLQVLYLPIVMFIAFSRGKNGGEFFAHIAFALSAAAMAYVAGQLASGLGWLTISAEEAPELLACAPVTPDEVARAKVSAVVLPVASLLFVLSAGLAVFAPLAGMAAFAGSVVCAGTIAYLELWMQRPGKRSTFRMRRRGTGSVWVSLLEMLLCMLFGAATGFTAAGSLWAIVPGLFIVAVVGIVASLNKDKWLTRDA